MHIETEIEAPADKVWQILAHQFVDISEWSTLINESRLIPINEIPKGYEPTPSAPAPARQTESSIGPTLIEVITHYSEEEKKLTFEGADMPALFFVYAKDTQSVIPISEGKSKLTFDIDIKLRGLFQVFNSILESRFSSTMAEVQNDLKIYAETGQIAN